MFPRTVIHALAALTLSAACFISPAAHAQKSSTAAAKDDERARTARRAQLSAAKSWAYQLRIRDLATVAPSDADLLVIDHGLAAKRDGKLLFDRAEIERLKIRADGRRRTVLAYLSIGEAEQYRFYWQGAWCKRTTAPSWIGAVNPNWPGNYPVRFWDAGWQSLILDGPDSYLAKIQSQGFDGIYLDRTDVWSEWTKERPTAERDMIAFLTRIAATARAQDKNFLVVMQNAEELLTHRAVRRAIDGVAKEDLLYGVNFTEAANDAGSISSTLANLRRARADGLPVFAVEYLADPTLIASARDRLTRYGFIPTIAPRLLDSLTPPDPSQQARLSAPAPSPAPTTTTPRSDWSEGGPTCLVD
jgi:cysteinyl-tRNA synthetase, unknown class